MIWWWRLCCALALGALGAGVATSQAWDRPPVPADDNARPPYVRPAIADVLPDAGEVASAVGRSFQVQDGPPAHQRLYYSTSEVAVDLRRAEVDGAWSEGWSGEDARTHLDVEVARSAVSWDPTLTQDCEDGDDLGWPAPYLASRRVAVGAGGAFVCATARVGATQLAIIASSYDADLGATLDDRVRTLADATLDRAGDVPEPPVDDHVQFDSGRARVNAIYLLTVLLVPLVWLAPNWLLDVATWDRLLRTVLVLRRRRRALGGLDADPVVRQRRWKAWAAGLAQWAAVVWVVRGTEELYWGGFASSAAILGSVVLLRTAPRALGALRGGARRRYRPRELAVLAAGAGVSLVIVLVAFGLLQLAGSYVATPDLIPDISPDAVRHFGYFVLLLGLAVLPLARLPFLLVRQLAMRALRDRVAPVDGPPPVLLLRSFGDDERRLRRHSSSRASLLDQLSLRRLERFEEVLAHVLGRQGPVIAVGQVGERIPPPLGAVRVQLRDDEWQAAVASYLHHSQLVCLTVGRSQSLAWEIQRIAAAGHLGKTLFVMPPVEREEELARLSVLADQLDLRWADVVPDAVARVLAVWVPSVGAAPVVLTALAHEDVGYEAAVDLVLNRMRAQREGAPVAPAPARATASVPRPTPYVYPIGQAPSYEPLVIRLAPLALGGVVLAGLVVWLLVPYFGAGGSVTAHRTVVDFNGSDVFARQAAYDPLDKRWYVATNAGDVGTVDFGDRSAKGLASQPGVASLAARDGRVFLVSPGREAVMALDPDSGDVLWSTTLSGARDLVATDDAVLVADSLLDSVVELDPATGAVVRRVRLDGSPWSIATQGDDVWVTLYDRGEVVRLDDDLRVRETVATPPGPAQVAATRSRVWVMSPLDHSVTAVVGPPGRVTIARQDAGISAAGGILVVEGIQQVTVVTDTGRAIHFGYDEESIGAVLAGPDDSLLVAVEGSVALIEPDL